MLPRAGVAGLEEALMEIGAPTAGEHQPWVGVAAAGGALLKEEASLPELDRRTRTRCRSRAQDRGALRTPLHAPKDCHGPPKRCSARPAHPDSTNGEHQGRRGHLETQPKPPTGAYGVLQPKSPIPHGSRVLLAAPAFLWNESSTVVLRRFSSL